MDKPLQSAKRSPLASILLWGMVAVLVIVGLLLPPISLGKRLFPTDFVKLDAENALARHPDGLELRADPALLDKPVRVQLDAISRQDFSGGNLPDEWQAAAHALPAHLSLKSPVYGISFKTEFNQPVHLEVAIPNEAEPYSLLDLYGWNGSEWQWLPSQLDVTADKVRADLAHAPQAVAVVRAGAQTPTIGMVAEQGDSLPLETSGLVTELYPTTLFLGPAGALLGQAASFGADGARYLQFPTSVSLDAALLQTLLADPNVQQMHLSALTNLAINGNYAGLNLDYRNVLPPQRDAFTAFVDELATGLHTAGLELVVTLPLPVQIAPGSWDTAGYDWPALAATAERLLLALPLDPAAFDQDGLVDQALGWAVGQVNRYQLYLAINAGGVQMVNGVFTPADAAEALAHLNTLVTRVDGGQGELATGSQVVVGVSLDALTQDPITGATQASYQSDGQAVTVWFPSGAALSRQLGLLSDFHLGGVVLDGLVDNPGMIDEFSAVLDAFVAAAAPPPALQQVAALTWTVQDASGGEISQATGNLDNPQFTWQAAAPGSYAIQGQLNLGPQVADLGAVEVVVAEASAEEPPEPEPTQAPEFTPTPTPEAVASNPNADDATAQVAPPSDADALIAGEVVNVREGPGTAFRQIAQLSGGAELQVLAVNPDNTWLRVSASDGAQGWVYAPLCTINISLADRPVEDVPTPTPAPTATPAPTPEGGAAPPPAAPPPSSSGGFELGGHIRGWDYLGEMGYAGMNWVKVQVHYGEDASGLVGMAHGNGFKIQLSALGSSDMVSKGNFHSDYGAWVAGMAAAGADAIEVWNEPNIDAEWPLGQISPTAYTQLLCSAYSAIKNANGGTAVISAAPAPTGYFGGCSSNGCDDLPWLQGMVNAGAANCMDYIGAHHNAGATSPSASSGHPADNGGGHHSWYFLPQTQLYYNVFGGSRKLFYTEMGYASQEGLPTFSDWFAWARGINNAQQAAWLAEAVSLSRSTGMVRCLIVWNLDFARYGSDPQDGYAIIRPGGSCPACSTMRAAMGY